ncbi:hypothetical protein [Micromonospora echinospora]|uniref:hypothetical protein n=1 Tax=Micromonospora echinospora TaxID=1877 RepID=UPI00366DDC5C
MSPAGVGLARRIPYRHPGPFPQRRRVGGPARAFADRLPGVAPYGRIAAYGV